MPRDSEVSRHVTRDTWQMTNAWVWRVPPDWRRWGPLAPCRSPALITRVLRHVTRGSSGMTTRDTVRYLHLPTMLRPRHAPGPAASWSRIQATRAWLAGNTMLPMSPITSRRTSRTPATSLWIQLLLLPQQDCLMLGGELWMNEWLTIVN